MDNDTVQQPYCVICDNEMDLTEPYYADKASKSIYMHEKCWDYMEWYEAEVIE